jgi:hypothetical protein
LKVLCTIGIRPKNDTEFDVDAILSLDLNEGGDPKESLNWIAERIRIHKDYKNRVKVKDRCVRIDFRGIPVLASFQPCQAEM